MVDVAFDWRALADDGAIFYYLLIPALIAVTTMLFRYIWGKKAERSLRDLPKPELKKHEIEAEAPAADKGNELKEREKEKREHEAREQEQREQDACEKEKRKQERLEQDAREKEALEKERRDKERLEQERREQEKREQKAREQEAREQERLEREKREREAREQEQREQERCEKEAREKELLEQERLEQERREKERLEQEQREQEKREQEAREKEQREQEKREEKAPDADKSAAKTRVGAEEEKGAEGAEGAKGAKNAAAKRPAKKEADPMSPELWTVLAVCAALDDKMFAGVPGHWERKLRLAIRAWKKSVKGPAPTEQNLKITLVLMSHSVVIVAEERLRNAKPKPPPPPPAPFPGGRRLRLRGADAHAMKIIHHIYTVFTGRLSTSLFDDTLERNLDDELHDGIEQWQRFIALHSMRPDATQEKLQEIAQKAHDRALPVLLEALQKLQKPDDDEDVDGPVKVEVWIPPLGPSPRPTNHCRNADTIYETVCVYFDSRGMADGEAAKIMETLKSQFETQLDMMGHKKNDVADIAVHTFRDDTAAGDPQLRGVIVFLTNLAVLESLEHVRLGAGFFHVQKTDDPRDVKVVDKLCAEIGDGMEGEVKPRLPPPSDRQYYLRLVEIYCNSHTVLLVPSWRPIAKPEWRHDPGPAPAAFYRMVANGKLTAKWNSVNLRHRAPQILDRAFLEEAIRFGLGPLY